MTVLPFHFNQKHDWQYHAKRISEAWNKQIPSIIETGQYLIEAKTDRDMPHGSFEAMVRTKLPFNASTARMLMICARHPIISNRCHVNALPPSYRTLYELTKLDHDVLAAALKDGTINSKTERKDITEMLARMKEDQQRKPLSGTRARIAEIAREKSDGVTVRDLQAALPDINPQTVNSTHSVMHKQGWFVKSGRTEKTSEGGRPSDIYLFTDTPEPIVHKGKTKAKAAPPEKQDRAIATAKAALIAALNGKSAYFITDTLLDIFESCEVSQQFINDRWFKRASAKGLLTTIQFNNPLQDFVPKRRKK